MHELSIGRALLKQVEIIAFQHEASSVVGVTVQIGVLSGVEGHLLRNAWKQIRNDSIAGNVELNIIPVMAHIHCKACGLDSPVSPNRLVCPECGSLQARLTSGDELLLESVDLQFQE